MNAHGECETTEEKKIIVKLFRARHNTIITYGYKYTRRLYSLSVWFLGAHGTSAKKSHIHCKTYDCELQSQYLIYDNLSNDGERSLIESNWQHKAFLKAWHVMYTIAFEWLNDNNASRIFQANTERLKKIYRT